MKWVTCMMGSSSPSTATVIVSSSSISASGRSRTSFVASARTRKRGLTRVARRRCPVRGLFYQADSLDKLSSLSTLEEEECRRGRTRTEHHSQPALVSAGPIVPSPSALAAYFATSLSVACLNSSYVRYGTGMRKKRARERGRSAGAAWWMSEMRLGVSRRSLLAKKSPPPPKTPSSILEVCSSPPLASSPPSSPYLRQVLLPLPISVLFT
jgi:hypothetical protein